MSAPSDPNAYPQAIALYDRLTSQAGNGVLLGHQDTSAYGVGWQKEDNRSDIKDTLGRWPAVYGWDLGGVEMGKEANIDGVEFAHIAKCIKEADRRGGINTISFHQKNPISGGDVFDNSPAVAQIVPDAEHHMDYLSVLDAIADFLSGLQRDDGTTIPVVLRPYHEANRPWPWWGMHACSEEEYVQLWQMTVNYLRDTHEMHQLLWCYSPQDVSDRDEYLVGYPGDEYVDVFGLDYYEIWDEEHVAVMGSALSMINQLAEERGKVAALTETGVQNIPKEDWWTAYLLTALKTDEYSQKTVWALLWRNKDEGHFFAPYPGHPSVENFGEMVSSELVVLGNSDEDQTQEPEEPQEQEQKQDEGFQCTIS